MQVKRFINRVNVFFSYFSLLALPFAMLCQSCTDKEQVTRLNEQIDSLRQENSKKEQNFKDMIDFVGVMADGLDSIAKHEEILFYTNKGKEGIYNDKEQMKRNLAMFDSLLFVQKQKIAQLADSLKNRGSQLSKLRTLVAELSHQLEAKSVLVAQLRSDLENSQTTIKQIRGRLQTLQTDNDRLKVHVQKSEEALGIQSSMINECYFKAGTKKELKSLGILQGGFLQRTKLNTTSMREELFTKVDIRTFTEIPLNSGNPVIRTQMPDNSYHIVKNGKNSSTLFIDDPTTFWSISNFLVIQL